jgi:hypothetical protein
MAKLEDAMERIRALECPTGDLENRVAGILKDYNVAGFGAVTINRKKELDRDGAQGYSVNVSGGTGGSFVVLADSGMDDYVAKVVEVYKNS